MDYKSEIPFTIGLSFKKYQLCWCCQHLLGAAYLSWLMDLAAAAGCSSYDELVPNVAHKSHCQMPPSLVNWLHALFMLCVATPDSISL